jgi:hypothetical protein
MLECGIGYGFGSSLLVRLCQSICVSCIDYMTEVPAPLLYSQSCPDV